MVQLLSGVGCIKLANSLQIWRGAYPPPTFRGIMANLVTLQEYKDFAGITGVSEDAKLNVIIPSISQAVKSYCGSSIVDYYVLIRQNTLI